MIFTISIPLTFALLAEDACPTPCEPGLPVHPHCLTVKKTKCYTKKHWLMAAFKYYTNSVHIYKGSGNSTASNSGCLI